MVFIRRLYQPGIRHDPVIQRERGVRDGLLLQLPSVISHASAVIVRPSKKKKQTTMRAATSPSTSSDQ